MTWKFNIGDMVCCKANLHALLLTPGWTTNRVIVGVILDRLTHECHGGTQMLYRIRFGCPDAQDMVTNDFHEFELLDLTEANDLLKAYLEKRDGKKTTK